MFTPYFSLSPFIAAEIPVMGFVLIFLLFLNLFILNSGLNLKWKELEGENTQGSSNSLRSLGLLAKN